MSLSQTVLRSSVLAALASPRDVDTYLKLINPMWTVHAVRAEIVAIQRETNAGAPVATITLQPNGAWAGHQAGQYVQVSVEIDGTRHTRCFSVSSAESGRGSRELITITVRANPAGQVSKHLVHEARIRDVVELSNAEGAFTLPNPLPTSLVLLSGGSGITPTMSILRTLLRRGFGGTVHFIHYAQSASHQIFAGELADLPPNVRVHLIYPESGGQPFDAEALGQLVPDFNHLDTWACGPAGLIDVIQQVYLDNPKLRVEYFKATSLSRPDDADGDTEFSASAVRSSNSGQTLLEQAEALGLNPKYGCRMGICFSCTALKTEGTIRNVVTGAESSQPEEQIQICVSSAVGPCSVEL